MLATLRKQLISAIMLVVLSLSALTTATYAWFVNNSTVEISTFQLQTSYAMSLLVAVEPNSYDGDGGDLTYKQFVTAEELEDKGYYNKNNDGEYTLIPVSTIDTNGFVKDTAFNDDSNAIKFRSVEPTETDPNDLTDEIQYYAEIPLWFLSSTDINVYLQKSNTVDGATEDNLTDVTDAAPAEGESQTHVQKIARVGFTPYTNVSTADYTNVKIYEPDPSDSSTTINRRNTTFYTGMAGDIDGYGITINNDGTVLNCSPQNIIEDLPVTVTDGVVSVDSGEKQDKVLFTLEGGVPKKVVLYIWLDGVDYDCISSIGAGSLNVKLALYAEPITV